MPKQVTTDEPLRKSFQLTMLFHADLVGGEGAYVRDSRGRYKDSEVELLYQGYRIAHMGDKSRLARFSPNRVIVPGLVRQLEEALYAEGLKPVTEQQVRVVLRVIGGSPVTQST